MDDRVNIECSLTFRPRPGVFRQRSDNMDLEKVLLLIKPDKHDDFRSFIETGITDAAFDDYINTDISCQHALAIIVDYIESILYAVALRRRLLAVARLVDRDWQDEFWRSYAAGGSSDAFFEYLEKHPPVMDIVLQAFNQESKLVDEMDQEREARNARVFPLDKAVMYAQLFEELRDRWLKEILR